MWKIDWNVLEEISPKSEFNKKLKDFIDNREISEIIYDGVDIDALKLSSGEFIYSRQNNPVSSFVNPSPCNQFLLKTTEIKALFKIEEDTKTGHNVEFYMFLGDRYKTLEEVFKAIEEYSEDDNTEQTYYYEHHTVVEYSHTIEATEKLIGEFDKETLDKVNQILKIKGIEFTIKGDK